MHRTQASVRLQLICKMVFALMLITASVGLFTGRDTWPFIQYANLIFHEAGHVLFMFFGTFLHVLGGSIGEIGIPALVTFHFALQRYWYSAGFGLWWLSTALWSVGHYASDARTQALPLITGDSSNHDWTYLLRELGLLKHDHFIGYGFFFLSIFVLVCALFVFYHSFMSDFRSMRSPEQS